MKKNKNLAGHLVALLTIIIWGTTFISTKILLDVFSPVEILFIRFIIGYLALLVIAPKHLRTASPKEELTFLAAGLCGICLYYLLENIALTYTLASNVGVMVSIAPFFTGILTHVFLKGEERLRSNFFIGFLISIMGIILISFNGSKLELNPLGDFLAIAAALMWGFYSILTKKIGGYGYSLLLTTRRTFFYGILFMLPALFLLDFTPRTLLYFVRTPYLYHFLFLGLGACALCFVTWNYAVKILGAVKTSVYIYLVPVITITASVLFLHERVTLLSLLGTILILLGLFLSEKNSH